MAPTVGDPKSNAVAGNADSLGSVHDVYIRAKDMIGSHLVRTPVLDIYRELL